MGASAWGYFTPYIEDLQAAFEQVKQDVFNSGTYYRPGANLPATYEEFVERYQIQVDASRFEQNKREYLTLKELCQRVPQSIAELLELNQESGTHTILDIPSISTSTDLNEDSGTLPDEEIVRLFGTLKPTREMVESKLEQLSEYRGRWMCTYITVYESGAPKEIFFTGYSGD